MPCSGTPSRSTVRPGFVVGAVVCLPGVIAAPAIAGDILIQTNTARIGTWDLDAPGFTPGIQSDGSLVGIEYVDGRLFAVTSFVGASANAFVEIDPSTGAFLSVKPTGLSNIVEGDLAYDPTTGRFLASSGGAAGNSLFEIDPLTGAATVVGPAFGAWDGLSFDDQGNLYAIKGGGATSTFPNEFLRLDPVTGAVLEDLSHIIADAMISKTVTGLDYDPVRGVFYAGGLRVFTSTIREQSLVEIDLHAQTTTELGVIDFTQIDATANGIAGVAFVPAPGTAIALALAGLGAPRRRPRPGPYRSR